MMKQNAIRPYMLLLMMTLVALGLWMSGCSTKYLDGTKIEDSPETREVIRVIETYRRAMESRDADMLIALASRNYFEKNGDSIAANNYDFDGLVNLLRSPDFRRITQLRMTIVYKSITFNQQRNVATVRYHYTSEFRIPSSGTSAMPDGTVLYDDAQTLANPTDPYGYPTPVGPAPDAGMAPAPAEDNSDQENWHSVGDDNEMILELENGRWYILKGM